MRDAHANCVAAAKICKRVGVLVVESSDANSFADDALGLFGFAAVRRLARLDLQQYFIASRF